MKRSGRPSRHLWHLWRRYAGFVAMAPKVALAYQTWLWLRLFIALVAMTVFAAFWRAAYAGAERIAGLDLATTLSYALLAQAVGGAGECNVLESFAKNLREGRIVHDLLRPVDFQLSQYAYAAGGWLSALALRTPLFIVAAAMGADLPRAPAVWICFLASFSIGASAMFLFEWMFGCLAFYTTEDWGLRVTIAGVAAFFGGLIVPLDLMPAPLRLVASALPFQQILYIPVSFLAGMTPVSAAPRVLLTQIAWLVGLLLLSRLVFRRAVRVVTVQGG